MPDAQQTVVFNQTQIQNAVQKVAQEIAAWLQSQSKRTFHLISVMEGAKPFARDLQAVFQKLTPKIEPQVHEIRIKGTDGQKLLETREWRGSSFEVTRFDSVPVLIVDDLVDSGATLKMLKEKVAALEVPDIKTAVLIRKFGSESGPVDFLGFDLDLNHEKLAQKGLKDYWLFGYGMDLGGKYRDLDYIGWAEVK